MRGGGEGFTLEEEGGDEPLVVEVIAKASGARGERGTSSQREASWAWPGGLRGCHGPCSTPESRRRRVVAAKRRGRRGNHGGFIELEGEKRSCVRLERDGERGRA